MNFTASAIQSFLANKAPFADLPSGILAQLSERLQPLRYRMGQTIVLRDKMPAQIAILYQGQARLLAYDPGTQMPTTLTRIEPGEIMGWVSLIRGVACETAIASTEAVCLTLNAQEFIGLLRQSENGEKVFTERPYLVEVFDLLSRQEALQSLGGNALKRIAVKACEQALVTYVTPERPLGPNGSHLWFVSSQDNRADSENTLTPGTLLDPNALETSLPVEGSSPVRLIGLREEDLTAREETAAETATPATPEPSVPPSEAAFSAIPYAPDQLLESEPETHPEVKTSKKSKYPFKRGGTPLEVGLACFGMLCQHFRIPFRQEIVRRVLAEQIQRNGNLSLYFCGSVAELLGLKAQLLNVPAGAFTRLNGPALVMWQDSLTVLYEISDRVCVIADPKVGVLRRKPADFLETWGPVGQVLLLQPTKETPTERFGISWFFPSIWQYRRVLFEVLVASFFVQLFGLANPLIIQVIIDQVIVKNSPDLLKILGIFLLAIAVFEALLSSLRTYLFVDTTNRIDMSLGSEIIDHLIRLPLRYFEKRPVGEISSRVNELENIRQFLTGTALTVVLDAVFSVVYIVVMAIYSWKLTLVALATVPIFMFLTILLAPTIRQQLRRKAERNAETQSYLV
ncbi:MAG: ABC transporter transmembrane domain-containing protein, partial [Spirulinaceae cyanobacterium]